MYKCWNNSNWRLTLRPVAEIVKECKSCGWNNNSYKRSCYTVCGQRCWNTEEVVTQSVVNDADTQKKLLHSPWSTMLKHKRSSYTVRGQWCWNIEEVVTQSVANDAEIQVKVVTQSVVNDAETVRTQIPWLKQPAICDTETAYNNSNKRQIKKLLLQPQQQQLTQHL